MASATTTGSAVLYENIQYELQSCAREAPHIVCTLQITNLNATDARLGGGSASYFIDQSGNRVGASNRSIANCVGWRACELVPNLATAARFEFLDQGSASTTLTRLLIVQNGKPVAQFTNVAVK
jgi:hypothetical protein